MTPWLSEMLTLETVTLKFIKNLRKGNYQFKYLRQIHSEDKSDKVIETTINKDFKTPGGLKSCSTKTNTVYRWRINASYRASLCSHLQEFL